MIPQIVVNRKGAGRIAAGHPWIFASDVVERGEALPGDAVELRDPRGRSLGTAHYSSQSQITLRLLSSRAEEIGRNFFLGRISKAEAYRKRVVQGTEAYRVVYGEADLLPGLVIDRYGDYFAVQTLSQGMDRARGEIVSCIQELFAPKAVVARNEAAVRKQEGLPQETLVLAGDLPEGVHVNMNSLTWSIDLLHGQKTGIFLDQRENYIAAAKYAYGRALDCFTFNGGFALHLAKSCASVEAIDSSAAALQTAETNKRLNQIGNVAFQEDDVFDALVRFANGRRRFDTIVLDPPAFTKSRAAMEGAMRGYKEINQRALRLLDSGGVLITCSCSHHLSEALLLEMLASAALDAGRTLRVIERRTQALDHPILLTVPETLYLKCVIVQVL